MSSGRVQEHQTRYGRTGVDRAQLAAFADGLLTAALGHASPSGSLITLPGTPGGYGTAVDGLEGYARTLLTAGFRLAGEGGADPLNLAERYAAGLAAGTDPAHPERWVRPEEHGQAKVEAASIALILDLTRPWIWDRLDAGVQERTVEYLSTVVGDRDYPHNNWVWFRIVVETFLRSVGGPWSAEDIERDLAVHDGFVRPDGWFSDGDERAYDHYAGWALHLYPILWARMQGAAEAHAPLGTGAGAGTRHARDVAHLDRFLQDAVLLVGSDGAPLFQGRSLTYRFAAAAPFWAGVLAQVPSASSGLLRQAATRVVGHFLDHGVPDPDGLLTLGWHHEWRRLAQRYSGTGSPYWASKGLLGLALPAQHPVWTAAAEPLPVDVGDVLAVAGAPGWAISGTRADGIVRVVNHGTDHAFEGDLTGDSPLYARLGYSTATSPLLDVPAWTDPGDQSVVLRDAQGRATHRSGFRTLDLPAVESAAVLGSVAEAHWLDADPAAPDHGSGRPGAARVAGSVTTVSVVRGAWEVRFVRATDLVTDGDATAARALEITGWAVSGADADHAGPGDVHAGGLRSRVVPLLGGLTAGAREHTDATPFGPRTVVPFAAAEPVPAVGWAAVAVGLWGPSADPTPPGAEVDDGVAVVTWPDGTMTRARLPEPGH